MKIGAGARIARALIYFLCIVLTILSILPFMVMFVNATRSTPQIQQNALSFAPSNFLMDNYRHMMGYVAIPVLDERGNEIPSDRRMYDLHGEPVRDENGNYIYRPVTQYERIIERAFNPFVGFKNSLIISIGVTLLALYFSSLTAYANVAYDWKFKNALFAFILFVMMIPTQVTVIGFFQFVFRMGGTNAYWPLILPAIASPTVVFFMRQYMIASLSIEMVESARIDGASEYKIYWRIVMPNVKPAWLTLIILSFQGLWANTGGVFLRNEELKPLSYAMNQIAGGGIARAGAGAAVMFIMMIVPVTFFIIAQSQMIETLTTSGMKD
jgi:multiple sugar transport system permease protein